MPELLPKIAELSEKLRKDPASRLFVPLAEEYVKAGLLEEAIQVLVDGLKRHPQFFSARVTLGRIYADQHKFKEAKVEFEQVLKASPDNLLALKKMATIYRMEGEREQAKKCCEMLLVSNPKDAEVRKLLDELTAADSRKNVASIPVADAPFEVERPSDALASTSPAQPPPSEAPTPAAPTQERDQDDAPEELVSPTLAQLYMRQGHYAQAVRVYDELLRREPNNETYRQAHNMAVALSQGEAGTAAGTDATPVEAEGPAASAPSAAPAAADDDFAAELLQVGQPPQAAVTKPPATNPNTRKLNKLQSWLLHIQQQRRRRAS
ncbi:MAG: tetratricopeptide repeat protein [Nitrospirae bacterium]|nr:tetratricopeptide repeat protein [Nitrospirota bacterium]